ncbi:hypothetical protein [Aquimarina mytili]|uniref:Uncharacterized protein n=1 Tax=Aquimarina mytili TaxID=874423 RepID=A0A937A8D6_9FLAO|nr:hypothetical protein [Aquimarina mytili]MBL0686104.1 hypothetical protein [Aquimarina mytili]
MANLIKQFFTGFSFLFLSKSNFTFENLAPEPTPLATGVSTQKRMNGDTVHIEVFQKHELSKSGRPKRKFRPFISETITKKHLL